jgi:DNA mismatch repair protein MutS
MQLCPYTSLHSRIWSHDNLWAGLSSFAVEVGELKDILDAADDKSLILGDEVCSGTESISATSLVAATLEHLHERKSHFLFATHLHDLLKVPGIAAPRNFGVPFAGDSNPGGETHL